MVICPLQPSTVPSPAPTSSPQSPAATEVRLCSAEQSMSTADPSRGQGGLSGLEVRVQTTSSEVLSDTTCYQPWRHVPVTHCFFGSAKTQKHVDVV